MDHYRENKLRIMQLDIIDDVAAPLYQVHTCIRYANHV